MCVWKDPREVAKRVRHEEAKVGVGRTDRGCIHKWEVMGAWTLEPLLLAVWVLNWGSLSLAVASLPQCAPHQLGLPAATPAPNFSSPGVRFPMLPAPQSQNLCIVGAAIPFCYF